MDRRDGYKTLIDGDTTEFAYNDLLCLLLHTILLLFISKFHNGAFRGFKYASKDRN